jgi:peroxiredoxin
LTYREPLGVGVSWFEGTLEFRVEAEERTSGVDSWRIEAKSPIGRKKTVWVDKASPLIVALSETVFIGQGEQHELRWELSGKSRVAPRELPLLVAAFDEFLRLRDRLNIEPRTRDIPWTGERLALLKADLPTFAGKAQGTPLEKLAKAAEQDSKLQKDRSNALGALHGKLVGRAAPRPRLETATGTDFAWPEMAGKVVVLHFWEYRDTPLEEPYGQVAYLDFLAREHKEADVRVFGVVADERVIQPDTKRAGIQSAKRLHAFMNLSYPLLVDDGTAIKEFGDPRVTGAKLPLYVVIDRQGNIAHYHAGYYEVHRDRGLEELSKMVRQALDKRD